MHVRFLAKTVCSFVLAEYAQNIHNICAEYVQHLCMSNYRPTIGYDISCLKQSHMVSDHSRAKGAGVKGAGESR